MEWAETAASFPWWKVPREKAGKALTMRNRRPRDLKAKPPGEENMWGSKDCRE